MPASCAVSHDGKTYTAQYSLSQTADDQVRQIAFDFDRCMHPARAPSSLEGWAEPSISSTWAEGRCAVRVENEFWCYGEMYNNTVWEALVEPSGNSEHPWRAASFRFLYGG